MPVIPPIAQGPLQAEESDQSASLKPKRDVNLLLTGYGPWASVKVNPSNLIANRLNSLSLPVIPSTSPSSSTVSSPTHAAPNPPRQININSKILRVSYQEVDTLTPRWHRSGEFDVMIHLGVAAGERGLRLETGAARTGYNSADVDGLYAPEVDGGRGVVGSFDRISTKLDTASLLAHLQSLGFEHIRESDNPGTFLCGYLTATSLKWSSAVAEDLKIEAIPVLFVHVPSLKEDGGPYTEEELTEIVMEVCRWAGSQV